MFSLSQKFPLHFYGFETHPPLPALPTLTALGNNFGRWEKSQGVGPLVNSLPF
jgi:hypothetical protein